MFPTILRSQSCLQIANPKSRAHILGPNRASKFRVRVPGPNSGSQCQRQIPGPNPGWEFLLQSLFQSRGSNPGSKSLVQTPGPNAAHIAGTNLGSKSYLQIAGPYIPTRNPRLKSKVQIARPNSEFESKVPISGPNAGSNSQRLIPGPKSKNKKSKKSWMQFPVKYPGPYSGFQSQVRMLGQILGSKKKSNL